MSHKRERVVIPPNIMELRRRVRRLERKLARLEQEYAWAHGMAYERQVVEGPYEAHVAVTNGDGGVPTAAVLDHRSLKDAMAKVAMDIDAWHAEVCAWLRKMELAMAAAEHPHGGLFESGLEPAVGAAAVAESRAAADRRRSRGELVP